MHFDWYKINASFHQYLRLSINNDYGNLGIFNCWNGPRGKIPHFIMKWNDTNFKGVNKYTGTLSSFVCENIYGKDVVFELVSRSPLVVVNTNEILKKKCPSRSQG